MQIRKLSRWEVIHVVRTMSTEAAKSGEEGVTSSDLCLKELVTLLSRHFRGPTSIRADVTPSRDVVLVICFLTLFHRILL